jgi:hypothetical protein
MACVLKFASGDIDVRDDHTGDRFSLRFACAPHSDDYVEVEFNRWNFAALAEQIVVETTGGGLRAPQAEHFDSLLTIEGHGTRKLPDGGVELTFHLRTDDGMRSMAIPMAADYARRLAQEILHWL